ncbi:NADH:ubiquinone oxidoreductase subunit A [Exilibacterium tricleocarpae]|uniref:NADH-quinone oxidoreductase subunit A n=1 Tax=Exilibacterium tricleocarpae TaxID=2591008 RepID=A0A545T1T5_9GAMM|nr:NADH-quinone oxidoreductase subunit A [Exilibacterium tricleocarpae]TQV71188.1 NADH:ubiquinone oxidoreductase subunit A [Exilibacterium tricleocarpae]
MSGDTENLAGLLLYFLAVIGLVALILLLSHLLGQRRRDKATGEPFESGVVSVGDAQLRFSAPFFLVAIFFVIFDLEAVFLFAWVIGFRESGMAGFIEAVIFIVILLTGLAYLWKLGALDWRRDSRRLSGRERRAADLADDLAAPGSPTPGLAPEPPASTQERQ